ncbi:MAG: GNAT family N-acetyltransferase [Chloroflexi bacterium]|nr:GNAT family N-acetyltransferase [Chloroflexota bacterium]
MANEWCTDKVSLRPIELDDWALEFAIMNDTDLIRHFDTVDYPPSEQSAKKWTEERSNKNSEEWFTWVIETTSGEKVGALNAFDVNRRKGTFYYGIVILPEYRRRGFAADAIYLMLRFYFQELHYNKCNATVYDFNEGSIKFHEQFGFQLEGRLRQMGFTQGRSVDHLIFGITAAEFVEISRAS